MLHLKYAVLHDIHCCCVHCENVTSDVIVFTHSKLKTTCLEGVDPYCIPLELWIIKRLIASGMETHSNPKSKHCICIVEGIQIGSNSNIISNYCFVS